MSYFWISPLQHIYLIFNQFQALISLQKKGITHRDISLENIMINENTHALVIDLGMCLRVPFKSPYGCNKVFDSTSGTLRSLLLPQGRCGKRN